MEHTIWTEAANLRIRTATHIQPGFSYGFDDSVPQETRRQLMAFMDWVEANFAMPVTLWVDFEYKHYLVSCTGKRVGYLFYWSDVETWPEFVDEEAILVLRLPVRDERWTITEIIVSFIEGLTDYFSWLCSTDLSAEEKERTVEVILQAYQLAVAPMQIIDYFKTDRKAPWLAQIAAYEWSAARFLASLLVKDEFHRTVGQGTVYLLTEGDKLVSFLTLAERDCVAAPYTPWIGFVHTAPECRGHRHIGKLLDHACAAAREHGAARLYLCTDHVGLYEKYGFTYLENRVSIYGEDSRIYFRAW